MKNKKWIKFQAFVLRYVHDVGSDEFVNIGVLLFQPDIAKFEFRGARSLRRFKAMWRFDCIQRAKHLKETLKHFTYAFEQYQLEVNQKDGTGDLGRKPDGIQQVAYHILPRDSSSLQWGFGGAGIMKDFDDQMDSNYYRLIGHYE